MKRLGKSAALLISLALFAPTLARAADPIPEQWASLTAPGAGYIGYEANEASFANTEASTWINFTSDNGKFNGKVTKVAICNTGAEDGCAFTVHSFYRAVLPVCADASDINCIAEIFATDANGKKLTVGPATVFPANNPQAFAGNKALNVPRGSGAALVSIPGAPHAGGDKYLIKTTLSASRSGDAATFETPRLGASISAVKIIDGDFFDLVTETNTAKYDQVGRIQVGTTQTKENVDPKASKLCVAVSTTQCALPYTMPKEISFGFSLRLNTNLSGWLHGRMKNAVIDYKTTNGITNLTVNANPIAVPVVDVWSKSDDLSDAHVSAYLSQFWAGEAMHYPITNENLGQPITDAEKTRTGMRNISFKHVNTNFSQSSMDNFLLWLPVAKDKAAAMPTQWRLGTMTDNGSGPVRECLDKEKALAGVVTTNSTMYIDGPPVFKDNTLDYKVASTHFEPDGTTVFKGSYELIMSSAVARCIYKFSSAPISATVSITSENGEANTATTVINEKNGWLKLGAYGFTFSSPTVRVKLTQEAAAPAPSPSPSESTAPVAAKK
ncbi:MAG: hypothetical protein RL201_109, partial [Actinomycetota bacterium]